MRYLTTTEIDHLKDFMREKGLGERSIDSYFTSINKSSAFLEINVLEMIKFVSSYNNFDKNEAAEYICKIYSKANPLDSKQAYNFKAHLKMAAAYALAV
jgi:hypothetical protein